MADVEEEKGRRRKRCLEQFIKQKCVKDPTKKLNANANDFDLTQLDVDKMKDHILDCLVALGKIQQELFVDQDDETHAASNKVFKESLSITATAMLHDGTPKPEQSIAVDALLEAFPDESKRTDGRGWLPLHWGVIAAEGKSVTEEVVKVVYASDPLALKRHHRKGTKTFDRGYTPVHLLCMQGVTQRNMSLIQYFSVCNEQAFSTSANYPVAVGDPSLYSYSALHAACRDGKPTEQLLKHLLQLDSSQMKKKYCEESSNGTPLGLLCENSSCSTRLITCLLEVDSSTEVVGSGLAGCLENTDFPHMLERVEMLLKVNPEAAKYRHSTGANLLSLAVCTDDISFRLCIDFIKRIVAIHKDAAREVDSVGDLPVYNASRNCSVEVMEFLLSLYPESASTVDSEGSNLLHLAAADDDNTTSVMEAKVRFLCSRCPALMLQSDSFGYTPLLHVSILKNIPAVQMLCEAGGTQQVRLPIAHPTNANYSWNGWLPLHIFIKNPTVSLRDSLCSKEADCYRMLLRLYPEAAGIEGGVGVVCKKTPYQLAVDKKLPSYYLRLLLRAAPDLNPAELHRLNYEERRMAMFLAFKAVTKNVRPLLLARLRSENKDLVKHVVSFL